MFLKKMYIEMNLQNSDKCQKWNKIETENLQISGYPSV
jgi:hypothetical protein